MNSQEKAINLRYLFLTYKPEKEKKTHQYIHLFLLLVFTRLLIPGNLVLIPSFLAFVEVMGLSTIETRGSESTPCGMIALGNVPAEEDRKAS